MRGLLNVLLILLLACASACGPAAPAPVAAATIPSASQPDAGAAAATCGADEPYHAAPPASGSAPELPEVPTIPPRPAKVGDAWTVFGATHALRSRFSATDVSSHEISIVGYIVDENMKTAPTCAIHKTGKADPEGCTAPIPTFVIGDTKDATTGIKVMGWARNYAILFDANALYAKGKPAQPLLDEMIQVEVPYPLPAIGAKVKVTGTFSFAFTRLSTGMVTDPQNGILTYRRMEVLEPAPKPAKLGK